MEASDVTHGVIWGRAIFDPQAMLQAMDIEGIDVSIKGMPHFGRACTACCDR
ncbi:MAG: hypothetical protein HYZ81_04365 [Nitrospinae bacterium]|nr:hypothetical protein [Nitrospinota bacterium]